MLEGRKMRKPAFFVILLLLLLSVSTIATAETNNFSITKITPGNLTPSEVAPVAITIKNIGMSSAFFVTTEILIEEPGPVKLYDIAKKSIEPASVGTGREATVQYTFYIDKDAKATVYHLPLRITWSERPDGSGLKNETLYFGIMVSGRSKEAEIDIYNVTTIPSEIAPGTKFSLAITVKNRGYSTVSQLRAGLDAGYPFTPLDSDLIEYIYDLEPSETATVYFNIAVSSTAPGSEYKIPLILVYEDEFGSHVRNTSIGIVVRAAPRIFIQEVILEPSKLSIDTEGIFMIRLINTGTESAEDTKIRISGGEGILTENHHFIGEIAPGQSQTATFGIYVGEEVPIGKHALKIDISYLDKYGTGYSNSKIYEISIFEAEELIPIEYIYTFIAIVLVSFTGYVVYKLRFKKEKGLIYTKRGKP